MSAAAGATSDALVAGAAIATRRILRFGPDERFVGILTGSPAASNAPVLLLPSAGLQPRSGPFRLHVELGERLAAAGLRTFRFDAPGVGEAPRVTGFDARAATIAAMDLLQKQHGVSKFAVGGICSAADIGWNTAMADERVSALLLLDGIAFTGPWFSYARWLDRLRRVPTEWRRMLRDARPPGRGGDGNGMGSADFRDWPTHEEAKAQFAKLVARRTRMLWIYTGGYTDRFLHLRQFRWAFGTPASDPCVEALYWPDCDHTFYARAHRDRLIDQVKAWLLGLGSGAGG
ncbi:alpha/beta fold hydrolase [Lysobacter korlensis]|uniref:Alpha/beta fold hydrolase n=1 Tax=Lysobacter korlensis TaxID=553636 RepID=A0ABV6RT74_9GAMM